ncbi:MAG: transporter [Cytophagaceae bacterium]|jgi:hypothetical protein|nr:transporter [Cytophagaceae bacterium]
MSDEEYQVLDELYFTIPFSKLIKRLEWEESKTLAVILRLLEKGWVKGIEIQSEMEISDPEFIRNNFSDMHFLATKKGLMAHNTL